MNDFPTVDNLYSLIDCTVYIQIQSNRQRKTFYPLFHMNKRMEPAKKMISIKNTL